MSINMKSLNNICKNENYNYVQIGKLKVIFLHCTWYYVAVIPKLKIRQKNFQFQHLVHNP